jgi:hypothetical protein
MRPKGLLVSVVLLAILGGVIWWSNKKQAASAKNPTDTTTKILTIPEDQFQEIRIKKTGGDTIDLKRDNGKWSIVEPKPYTADPDTSSSLVSALTSINADKTVEDKATDLSPYGLKNPQIDVTVTRKDGKTNELLIGDDTPPGNSGNYVKLAGDPHVYTVLSFVKTGIDKSLNDLRDKRLMTFDSDKLTRVELQAKGAPVEFGKNSSNEWTIVKPKTLRADSSSVETVIGKLKDAKMDLASPDADAAKKFAAATKIATAGVTDAGGTQTLEVRQDKDKNYFAKSSAMEGVYKIATDVGDGLNKSLDDFRNKKLFDFGFSDPGKVDVKNGAAAAGYTKSGDKWMLGAKAEDNSTVQNLIDKLRDLAATKFSEKGGGSEVFSATVVSNSGKRNEKVTITKQGEQYFAQREGEPSIYELDKSAVEGLQKAASDVKDAPPETPKKK